MYPPHLDVRYWNSIEDYCRKLTKKYKEVSIVSGPLYLPETDPSSGKKFVKYEVSENVKYSPCLLLFELGDIVVGSDN